MGTCFTGQEAASFILNEEYTMQIVKEFKEFAMRGNVVDLAVGLIIGGAFGKIVSSLVSDVLMPPIGRLMGNVDFSSLFISLDPEKTAGIDSLSKAKETGAALIAYGAFLNAVVDFIIVAACVFALVKLVNRLKREPAVDGRAKIDCPYCLLSIPAKARRCAHCTSELKPATTSMT
jgi:large conductance mechanosensitive channel